MRADPATLADLRDLADRCDADLDRAARRLHNCRVDELTTDEALDLLERLKQRERALRSGAGSAPATWSRVRAELEWPRP